MHPTPVVGFAPPPDTPRGDNSRALTYGSDKCLAETPQTPISPLSLALKQPGSQLKAHRRSLSDDCKFTASPDSSRQSSTCCADCSGTSVESGIPIPETRRSYVSEGGESAAFGDKLNFFAPSVPKERACGSLRPTLWEPALHIPRQAEECADEVVSTDEEEFDTTWKEDQEVFELEIPVPGLPFLRSLTRIRTSVRCEPTRPR